MTQTADTETPTTCPWCGHALAGDPSARPTGDHLIVEVTPLEVTIDDIDDTITATNEYRLTAHHDYRLTWCHTRSERPAPHPEENHPS